MQTLSRTAVLAASLVACSAPSSNPNPNTRAPYSVDDSARIVDPPLTNDGSGAKYDGKGFVVHEWGTNTVVVGSDGKLLTGLHHEEEGLPAFVYDRKRAAKEDHVGVWESKMETPVTYFYSDVARSVRPMVSFPNGVFTQWYPQVAFSNHMLARLPADGNVIDPLFDVGYNFRSEACRAEFGTLDNGMLDWGSVEVLPRGVAAPGPEAPLSKFTWDFAREVDSNALLTKYNRNEKSQTEKFLFYRGLGNFDYPLTITNEGTTAALNRAPNSDSSFASFVIRTTGELGAYNTKNCASDNLGIPAESELRKDYVEPLSQALVRTMEDYGLFHDEALAMVNTWRRQWLRTPGVRVLYITSQAWTDALIPLTITPKPDRTVRMMMIRNELLTPEVEQADVAALTSLTGARKQTYFSSLGRFAEPRLRRACAIAKCANTDSEVLDIIGKHGASGNSAQQ